MAEHTGIEWCHHTFNPWWGCSKVTQGCKHCYAETLSARFHGDRLWGVNGDRKIASEATWREPLRWNMQADAANERRRVFCASMADVFERHANPETNAKLDAARARLWSLIEATPHLDWLLLTKRPENIGPMVPSRWRLELPANVWLGASVCGDATDAVVVKRLATWVHSLKARHGFLSYEPAVGAPVFLYDDGMGWIDWIIVGGESGPAARPFHADWARDVIEHGRLTGTKVFVKQLGAKPTGVPDSPLCMECGDKLHCEVCGREMFVVGDHRIASLRDKKGGDPAEWPADLRVREVPT